MLGAESEVPPVEEGSAEPVSDTGSDRVLAIFSHPDDAEIAAGATLAKWLADGRPVTILILTNGEKGSQDPGEDLPALVRKRQEESLAAAKRLGGADVVFLDFVDGELENSQEVRSEIVAVIRRLHPALVVCPDPSVWFFGNIYYNHSDHRVTGVAALDAVAPAAGNPHFFPELLNEELTVWDVPKVWLSPTTEPNHSEDVTGFVETKMAALEEHASQLDDDQLAMFRAWIPQSAEEEGRKIGVTHAEGFRILEFT